MELANNDFICVVHAVANITNVTIVLRSSNPQTNSYRQTMTGLYANAIHVEQYNTACNINLYAIDQQKILIIKQ